MMKPHDAGFTLIEALVAMAVLAVGAVSLLSAAESNTTRISAITDRTTARWVAEYRLTELRLAAGDMGDIVTMMGQDWRVGATRTATTDPELSRVDVTVGPADGGGLVTLAGYLNDGALNGRALNGGGDTQ